jgi:hypothetical protein
MLSSDVTVAASLASPMDRTAHFDRVCSASPHPLPCSHCGYNYKRMVYGSTSTGCLINRQASCGIARWICVSLVLVVLLLVFVIPEVGITAAITIVIGYT